MKAYIVVLFFMAMSVLWSLVVNDKWRRVLMPWCMAIMLMNISCAAFYVGPLRLIYGLSNYMIFVVLCDGFGFGKRGQNPVWTLFLVFWAYMLAACLLGCYKIEGLFYWIKILFTSICCGYYFSRWVIRSEGALRRTSLAFAVTGMITLYLYWRHGGIAVMDSSMGMRAHLDVETLAEGVKSNSNYTASVMMFLMMFLMFAIIRPVRSCADTWLKWVSAAEFTIAGIMMIRCGSRGAVIGLLPALWFVVSSGTGRLKRRVRIGVMVTVGIVMAIGVYFVKGNVESLRAFKLSDSEATYATTMDSVTTGRVSLWERILEDMKPIDYIVGKGLVKTAYRVDDDTGARSLTVGNAHSMYITVLHHAGTIGLILFFSVIISCFRQGLRMGVRGRIALVFLGSWVLTGIGESSSLTGTFAGVIAGICMGLLTLGPAANSEFGEKEIYWAAYRG